MSMSSKRVEIVHCEGTRDERRLTVEAHIQPEADFFAVDTPVYEGDVVEIPDPRGGTDRRSVAAVKVNDFGSESMRHIEAVWGKPPAVRGTDVQLLGIEGLHQAVIEAASELFADGHYSQAIFEAFKALEVRVRTQSGLDLYGRPAPAGEHVGLFGPGGESAAHRMLKLYVAGHPLEFGLSAAAVPHVEYSFATGDRVDVMFENHLPDRTVVEVEVEGEQQLCIGIHQAIKYRSLAAADAGFPLLTSRVRSVVVAYTVDYTKARELAERYDIPLLEADRETVLAGAR